MTVEELIKKLSELPQDSKVFVSHLCMGWISEKNVKLIEDDNFVKFVSSYEE